MDRRDPLGLTACDGVLGVLRRLAQGAQTLIEGLGTALSILTILAAGAALFIAPEFFGPLVIIVLVGQMATYGLASAAAFAQGDISAGANNLVNVSLPRSEAW